jgi:hypothetical protein
VTRPPQPLYLARETYLRRRAMDAVRILPFLGLFLVMLPLLWEDAGGPGSSTAFEGLYLFAVWAGLILGAAVLSRRLADRPEAPAAEERYPAAEAADPAAPAPGGQAAPPPAGRTAG